MRIQDMQQYKPTDSVPHTPGRDGQDKGDDRFSQMVSFFSGNGALELNATSRRERSRADRYADRQDWHTRNDDRLSADSRTTDDQRQDAVAAVEPSHRDNRTATGHTESHPSNDSSADHSQSASAPQDSAATASASDRNAQANAGTESHPGPNGSDGTTAQPIRITVPRTGSANLPGAVLTTASQTDASSAGQSQQAIIAAMAGDGVQDPAGMTADANISASSNKPANTTMPPQDVDSLGTQRANQQGGELADGTDAKVTGSDAATDDHPNGTGPGSQQNNSAKGLAGVASHLRQGGTQPSDEQAGTSATLAGQQQESHREMVAAIAAEADTRSSASDRRAATSHSAEAPFSANFSEMTVEGAETDRPVEPLLSTNPTARTSAIDSLEPVGHDINLISQRDGSVRQPAPGITDPSNPNAPLRLSDGSEAVDRLVHAAKLSQSRAGARLQLQLDPPELGRVHVELRQNSNGLTLELQATTTKAHNLLSRYSRDLQHALESQGFLSSRIDIQLRPQINQEGTGNPSQQQRGQAETGAQSQQQSQSQSQSQFSQHQHEDPSSSHQEPWAQPGRFETDDSSPVSHTGEPDGSAEPAGSPPGSQPGNQQPVPPLTGNDPSSRGFQELTFDRVNVTI